MADGAGDKAGAGSTVGVVVLPFAVEARRDCSTLHAADAPVEEGWGQGINTNSAIQSIPPPPEPKTKTTQMP